MPLKEPLYIFADTMNDFNFYTQREVIPVLQSEAEVQTLSRAGGVYLLVRGRDLPKMDLLKQGEVLATAQVGKRNGTW